MQETRKARLAAVIQEELSLVVPREVKDPRVPPVTFTAVEMTPDGSQATVYVSIFGGAQGVYNGDSSTQLSDRAAKLRMQSCIDGLTSASGFLRKHLSKALTVRHVPKLIFKEDKGLENAARVFDLLKKL